MDKNHSELDMTNPIDQSLDPQEFRNGQDEAPTEQTENVVKSVDSILTYTDVADLAITSENQEFVSGSIEEMEQVQPVEPILPPMNYQAEIDKLLSEREILASEAVVLNEQLEKQEAETNSLHQWMLEQKGSFLWKVLNRMSLNKSEVQSKLDGYQDFINRFEVPMPGKLVSVRKRFHKSLLITWLVILVIAALFFYLPQLALNSPGVVELSRIVNSADYPTRWQIVFITLILLLLTLGSLLIQYYKSWSSFERKVTVSLWKLDEISNNVRHCRDEQARLTVLHPQVKDWLEIIGNALNKPWEIDEKWLSSSLNEIPQDDFPFALRIAQAQENDHASSLKLKRDAAERYLTRGWRTKVFEDQVLTAGELMGMGSDRLNVEILDADIALSRGGPRAILGEKIKDSELLKSVAKKQLLPLMKIVQIESIAESRPPVSENRTDLLDKFQPEDFDLALSRKLVWDDFLAISMGDIDKPRTPLSQLAFSETGRQYGHHDLAKSIFITPNRLISRVPDNESTFADSYGESIRLPLDIVVRMDISGPLQQDDVFILKRSDEEIEKAQSNYEKTIRDATEGYKSGV